MSAKRTYTKPEIKTRTIELGVFGDYSDGGDGGSTINPKPVRVIEEFDLHME